MNVMADAPLAGLTRCNVRRIALRNPLLSALRAGECRRFRRPLGLLARCRPGDRLWIAEPFALPRCWDSLSPLQALDGNAAPIWPEQDVPLYADPVHARGRIRFARELPRQCHRAHLVIDAMAQAPLHDVTLEEARAEGHPTLSAYAAAWEASSFGFATRAWDDNPTVIVLDVTFVGEPLS